MTRIIIADNGNYVNGVKESDSLDEILNTVGIAKCKQFGAVYFQITKDVMIRLFQSRNIWECCMCPILDNEGNAVKLNDETYNESYVAEINDEINRMMQEQDGMEMRMFAHMTVRWMMNSAGQGWFRRNTEDLKIVAHMDKQCCYIKAVSIQDENKNMLSETCNTESAFGEIETIENDNGKINVNMYIRLSEELNKKGCTIYKVETDGDDANMISVIGACSNKVMVETLEEVTSYKDFSDRVAIIGYYEESKRYPEGYTECTVIE